MAANWLYVGKFQYINASKVEMVKFLPSENKYEVHLMNKEVMKVDCVEHATTFDIAEEKEIKR